MKHVLELRFLIARYPLPTELLKTAGTHDYMYSPYGGKAIFELIYDSKERAEEGRTAVLARWPEAESRITPYRARAN